MGTIRKLKPEIRDFILAQKNGNSALSCRKLTALVLANFKIELSKSSINALIKETGLSAPVGRPRKKRRRRRIVMPVLPVLLLEDTLAKEAEVGPPAEEVSPSASLRGREAPEAISEDEIASSFPSVAPRNDENEVAARKGAQEEAEQKAKEEAERKAQEEARQKAQEEQFAQEEAAQKAEEEKWIRLAEEEKRAEEEVAKRSEEEAEKESNRNQEELTPSPGLSFARLAQLENTGIILLRAADSILGVSRLIASTVRSRLPRLEGSFEAIVEGIIYLPLLQEKIENNLVDQISGALEKIENIPVMNLDISRIITLGLQEVRCVKVILADGSNLYLDAQLYSVWSSPHVPYDFASPIYDLKKRINQYFNADSGLILFNAPGYDLPSLEFFNFLASFEGKGANITNLVLYGNKFEELEVLPIVGAKKRSFIFAIWPWQFSECRKVKSLGEFRRFHHEEQDKDLYIAGIEMELRQPGTGQQITLYGCALKLSPNEKTRLVILSNFDSQDKGLEELAAMYLNRWPNLDEAFQDYSRKIELFTYTANSQRYFSAENLNLGLAQVSSARDLFRNYLTALDAFVRWHLLPSGYEDKELSLIKERFYDLGLQIAKDNASCCTAGFILPSGYACQKDLEYLCRRLNEKEVELDGKRFLLKP